jgi:hypothetical protein
MSSSGLYYSFPVLVVAEMLDAKFGLGWYIRFQTAYSGYANVCATLVIMALICAGVVKLLLMARDRLLGCRRRSSDRRDSIASLRRLRLGASPSTSTISATRSVLPGHACWS